MGIRIYETNHPENTGILPNHTIKPQPQQEHFIIQHTPIRLDMYYP